MEYEMLRSHVKSGGLIYLPRKHLSLLLQSADDTWPWQGEHCMLTQPLNKRLKKIFIHSRTSVAPPYHMLVRNNYSHLPQKPGGHHTLVKQAAAETSTKSFRVLPLIATQEWLLKSFNKCFLSATILIMHRKGSVSKPPCDTRRQAKHSFKRVFLPWVLLGLLDHALQSWVSVPLFTPCPPWDFKPCAKQRSPAGTVIQMSNSLLFYGFP